MSSTPPYPINNKGLDWKEFCILEMSSNQDLASFHGIHDTESRKANKTKLTSLVSFVIRISKLLQLSWISWRWGWGSGSWGLGRGILSCSLESCLACPLSLPRPSIKTLCLLKFKVMVTPSPPPRAGSGSDGYKVLLLHQPGRSPLQHNLANFSPNLWPIWRNWPI